MATQYPLPTSCRPEDNWTSQIHLPIQSANQAPIQLRMCTCFSVLFNYNMANYNNYYVEVKFINVEPHSALTEGMYSEAK